MPDLLLELFSEEIPARMQRRAADDLQKLVTDALVEAGLVYEGAKAFATPRRLALTVHGLPARSPDQREERKGPRVGAPDKAIEGFLKGAGLDFDRAGDGPAGQEGRFLRCRDREARPPGARGDRRFHARHPEVVPVAEVDALGRELGQARQPHLGAPAAFHPLRLRSRDRGHRGGAVRGRRPHVGRRHLRPPLHGARPDPGEALRRLRRPSWSAPRSCSMPTGARR